MMEVFGRTCIEMNTQLFAFLCDGKASSALLARIRCGDFCWCPAFWMQQTVSRRTSQKQDQLACADCGLLPFMMAEGSQQTRTQFDPWQSTMASSVFPNVCTWKPKNCARKVTQNPCKLKNNDNGDMMFVAASIWQNCKALGWRSFSSFVFLDVFGSYQFAKIFATIIFTVFGSFWNIHTVFSACFPQSYGRGEGKRVCGFVAFSHKSSIICWVPYVQFILKPKDVTTNDVQ